MASANLLKANQLTIRGGDSWPPQARATAPLSTPTHHSQSPGFDLAWRLPGNSSRVHHLTARVTQVERSPRTEGHSSPKDTLERSPRCRRSPLLCSHMGLVEWVTELQWTPRVTKTNLKVIDDPLLGISTGSFANPGLRSARSGFVDNRTSALENLRNSKLCVARLDASQTSRLSCLSCAGSAMRRSCRKLRFGHLTIATNCTAPQRFRPIRLQTLTPENP